MTTAAYPIMLYVSVKDIYELERMFP